ncbi:MAG: helix-turn-helix domain-containing protein, partial [Bacteroidota bacterium]|nr:helix-turn-helix domain-containing protein [Bacteroidota bacterium]
ISDTILSDRLKLLEKYGLITRIDHDEIPPKVEYSLTERGDELSALLDKICEFSEVLLMGVSCKTAGLSSKAAGLSSKAAELAAQAH